MNRLVRVLSLPSWVSGISGSVPRPTHRVPLAMLPTPIDPLPLSLVPSKFTLSIKRDDMTGSTLSGNKVRKLEFLLADALLQGKQQCFPCVSSLSHKTQTQLACVQVLTVL